MLQGGLRRTTISPATANYPFTGKRALTVVVLTISPPERELMTMKGQTLNDPLLVVSQENPLSYAKLLF